MKPTYAKVRNDLRQINFTLRHSALGDMLALRENPKTRFIAIEQRSRYALTSP
jgi:hypothetical protein